MAREVKWSEVAWSDLEEAADYIAKDSPHYAAAFVREARDAAHSLAYLAERGRIVPEFNNSNIRELFVGSYRVVYQVTEGVVYIIGFIHGARNLWALWEREGRPRSGSLG
ncbi:MAG: type II toxin-antitoxin system RelE/ParE family toxin [Candidatus Latescibacteria bacterium]|nr:type II toxin-antitoxin system RelE/ParE family toxin [Candidatus Latescibacterota bacterium]